MLLTGGPCLMASPGAKMFEGCEGLNQLHGHYLNHPRQNRYQHHREIRAEHRSEHSWRLFVLVEI